MRTNLSRNPYRAMPYGSANQRDAQTKKMNSSEFKRRGDRSARTQVGGACRIHTTTSHTESSKAEYPTRKATGVRQPREISVRT